MYDSDSKGISYGAGFYMLIAFTLAAVFLSFEVSKPIWVGMTGHPYSKEQLSNPAYTNAAKLLQSITAIIGFLLPALVTAFLLHKKPLKLLGFSPRITPGQAGLAILIIGLALLVSSSLSWFTELIPVPASWKIEFDQWENDYNKQVEAIVGLNNAGEYVIALVVMAFLPALCEETLFRGGLQNFLGRSTRNPWLSVIIVSIIFSAVHWSFYGFLSRFFLGMILGLLYHYSGRLWLSILAHFVNNALAITVLYVYKMNGKPLDKAIDENAETFWGILALPLLIGLLMVFRRISFNTKNR